jgi:hypothetical protein
MTHRGAVHCKVSYGFGQLRAAIEFLLKDADWSAICWRRDCTWGSARLLSVVSLLWAWGDQKLLVDCFLTGKAIAVKMYPQRQAVAGSYQAFLKLLKRWNEQLTLAVSDVLRKRMCEEFAHQMKVGRYTIMAVDGTRISLPRTKSIENEFSFKRHKSSRLKRKKHRTASDEKKANYPTMWVTTLWNCGTGLPWMWRRGPGDSSERAHWMDMLKESPLDTLFVADAGYVGYDYLLAVVQSGRQFILRIGANVRLIKNLGYARERQGTVYLWPEKEARKKSPPLVGRLVISHSGKQPVYLLTSVLSEKELPDAAVISAYRRRWGVEVFYRHFKQTFGKHKLRSTSAEAAYIELDWAYLGLCCMATYAVKQLDGQAVPPRRLSFSKLIRAFQTALRSHPLERRSLKRMLLCALVDEYQRGNKTNRGYPRKKNDRHRPSTPIIRQPTNREIALAQDLLSSANGKLRLTA